MEVLDPEHSGINLFDDDWKIYSRNSGMTGHRISADAVVENSMITDGCRISGNVKHSILFAGVTVEPGAEIEDAVIMGGTTIKAGAVVKPVSYTHLDVYKRQSSISAARSPAIPWAFRVPASSAVGIWDGCALE